MNRPLVALLRASPFALLFLAGAAAISAPDAFRADGLGARLSAWGYAAGIAIVLLLQACVWRAVARAVSATPAAPAALRMMRGCLKRSRLCLVAAAASALAPATLPGALFSLFMLCRAAHDAALQSEIALIARDWIRRAT